MSDSQLVLKSFSVDRLVHFDSDSDKQLVDSSTIPSDPLLPPTEPVETLASSSVVQQFHLELLDHSESS